MGAGIHNHLRKLGYPGIRRALLPARKRGTETKIQKNFLWHGRCSF